MIPTSAGGWLPHAGAVAGAGELCGGASPSTTRNWTASGFRLAANWGQTYPRRFKEIYRKTGLLDGISPDERQALKDHLTDLFWRVSKSNGHKRLVLKSPPQLGRVAMLAELYPDALRLVTSGRVDLKPFIERHPLTNGVAVLRRVADHEITRRAILEPGEGERRC